MTLKSEIEKAISAVCQRLINDKPSIQECLDALKSLAPFYVALNKGKKLSEDEPDGDTFAGFANGIANAKSKEETDGGNQAVPGRRRHS